MLDRTRIAFVTLGCKVNQTESEAMAESLGVAASRTIEDAHVIVINTCTVTAEADHKARKAVRHALGLPLTPTVVVTGCLATLDAPGLAALGERVLVEPDKSKVPERVRGVLGGKAPWPEGDFASRTRARAQLKVQDGCDAFCTYCIVPHARGVPTAVPLAEVVARAERLAATGVKEVVLTGINIGRYRDGDADLPAVLRAVAAAGISRVRLSSIEPRDVTEALLEAAASLGEFCPHLHVPLQSGSDAVLGRMGRPYDTGAYSDTLARIRRVLPDTALSTDVIVGFPGETDEEFAETLAFIEAQAFSRLHVFRYSIRPGTPAATMPAQVPAAAKAARSASLRDLGERLSHAHAAAQAGCVAELLVERIVTEQAERYAEGTTREYLRLRVPLGPADAHVGQLLRVLVEPLATRAEQRGRLLP